ncbi:MAG TPA: DUF4157 domain-containing protein, partial [Kofleriaceae bacterium]|nr:DUF4157 domain-containing protein [Kofleriaceae bacterium]
MSRVGGIVAEARGGGKAKAATSDTKAGTPLEHGERDYFGARFGHDFSHVRVHADGESLDAARALHARAFTLANHVVLADPSYRSGTHEGRQLLAHELAHVVQQASAGPIPRPASWLAWPQRTRDGDRHELDASRTARVALREPGPARPQQAAAPMIAAQPDNPAKDEEAPVDQWKGTPISRMVISLARGRVAMVMANGALTGDVTTDLQPGSYTITVDKTTPPRWRFLEPKVPEGVRFELVLDQANPWTLRYPDKIPLQVSAGSSANVDDNMPWSQLQSIIMIDPEFLFEHVTPEPVAGIDDFETAKYKLDYKAVGGNLSNVILVEYRNGTTKDIAIPSITQATPRLWEAAKKAREIQGEFNFEFELQTFGTVWFILTMGATVDQPEAKADVPAPEVETPGPKVEAPGPKVEAPGPKVETPGPKVETPGPKVET